MFQLSPLVIFKRSPHPKVELRGREMADDVCLKMPDFHVSFRDLLHAVNLRHARDGFSSPSKEGVLRIFSPWKIRRLRSGLNPRTWVPKASTLPLDHWRRLDCLSLTYGSGSSCVAFWGLHCVNFLFWLCCENSVQYIMYILHPVPCDSLWKDSCLCVPVKAQGTVLV